jgi:hypothetical protein
MLSMAAKFRQADVLVERIPYGQMKGLNHSWKKEFDFKNSM